MSRGANKYGGHATLRPRVTVSPHDPEWKACKRKVRLTEGEAKDRATLASLQTGEEILAYPCRFCKGWHIGHERGMKPEEPTVLRQLCCPPEKKDIVKGMVMNAHQMLVKYKDSANNNQYVFEVPRNVLPEEAALKQGKLLATKNGDDFWRFLDGARCPRENWHTYNMLAFNHASRVEGFDAIVGDIAEELNTKETPKKFNTIKGLDDAVKDVPQTFLGKQVCYDEQGWYVTEQTICCDCKVATIDLRAKILTVNGEFRNLQAYRAVSVGAKLKHPRGTEWVCADCNKVVDVPPARIIELPKVEPEAPPIVEEAAPAAEPEKIVVEVAPAKEDPRPAHLLADIPPNPYLGNALPMPLAFLEDLERMVLDNEVPAKRVRGMAWAAARVLQAVMQEGRV